MVTCNVVIESGQVQPFEGKTMTIEENIRKAMKRLEEVFVEDIEGTGLLTVDQVCKVHRILMKGLHVNMLGNFMIRGIS